MKRIMFRWTAILTFLAASGLFASWAVSFAFDPNRVQLAFGQDPSFAQVAAAKGELILCDHFANREVIDLVDKSLLIRPSVAKDVRRSFPGFTYRHLTLSTGQPIWSVSLSLLIPCLLMASSTGVCAWRLRALEHQEPDTTPAVAYNAKASTPQFALRATQKDHWTDRGRAEAVAN